jgi:hypothetical protein
MCCGNGTAFTGGGRFAGLVTVVATAVVMKCIENSEAVKVLSSYRRHFGAR